jgi:hypothetical protein
MKTKSRVFAIGVFALAQLLYAGFPSEAMAARKPTKTRTPTRTPTSTRTPTAAVPATASGAHDPRRSDSRLGDLKRIPGSAFEAVYTGEIQH